MKRVCGFEFSLALLGLVLLALPFASADENPPPAKPAPATPPATPPVSAKSTPNLIHLLEDENTPFDLLEILSNLSVQGDPAISSTRVQETSKQLGARLGAIVSKNLPPREFIEEFAFLLFATSSFRYEPQGPFLLGPLFQTQRGGLASLTSLWTVLARHNNIPISVALTGDHLLCRYGQGQQQFNIELTEMGEVLPDRYYKLRHGAVPRTLSDREFVGYLLYRLSRGVFHPAGAQDRATAALSSAVRLFPNYPPIHSWLASLSLEKGDENKALAHLELAIRDGSVDIMDHMHRARLLRDPRQIRAALAGYNQKLTREPISVTAIFGKANLLVRLERSKDAIEFLEEKAQEIPSGPDRERLLRWRHRFQEKLDLEIIKSPAEFSQRMSALDRLQARGQVSAIPTILELLDDSNYRIRWAAAHAIRRIAGVKDKEFGRLGLDSVRWNRWWSSRKKSP